VFNQFTEQFSINELAELVCRAAGECGMKVTISHVENPRVEKEEHYYNARHTKLIDLGLTPHLLSETLVEHVFEVIERHRARVITDHIVPTTTWRGGCQVGPRPAESGQPIPTPALMPVAGASVDQIAAAMT
jgi:UDP-sulfoquinovose synthase